MRSRPEAEGTAKMGMFDHVVVLDEMLQCPHGHRVEGFQTKSFDDPSMDIYLFAGPSAYRVVRGGQSEETAAEHWQLDGTEAVFQRRHPIEAILPPREIVFYTSCEECPPVLVRCDRARVWGDLVEERQLWVEFRATFGPGERRRIDRTSGTRDDLITELREEGLRVLGDDAPLAIAHREIRAAREEPLSGRTRTRR
jgi:hypothetical protein